MEKWTEFKMPDNVSKGLTDIQCQIWQQSILHALILWNLMSSKTLLVIVVRQKA